MYVEGKSKRQRERDGKQEGLSVRTRKGGNKGGQDALHTSTAALETTLHTHATGKPQPGLRAALLPTHQLK